jgi:hypothetical protein
LSTRRQSLVIFTKVLSEQLKELFRVLSNNLSNLGVASGNLLQDGLEHLGLLLYQLTELLEVRVAAKEIQVCITTSRTTGTSGSSTTTTTLTSLGSSLEHVERFVATKTFTDGRGVGMSLSLLLLLMLLRLLLTLGALGDTLKQDRLSEWGELRRVFMKNAHVQQVFNSTVRVEECGAHGALYHRSFESHGFHLLHGTLGGTAHSQGRRITKGSRLIGLCGSTASRGWGGWYSGGGTGGGCRSSRSGSSRCRNGSSGGGG